MSEIPHYVQAGAGPAITGQGFGLFGCPCGNSLLIAGYEPRQFLGIAIRCAACGEISQTPGLSLGAPPPPAVTLVERGAEQPPAVVAGDTVLIGREEMERLAALYLPRATDTMRHVVTDALLDEVEFQQQRWTGVPLDPSARSFKDQALSWAVAHFRARLREPGWTTFVNDVDLVAATVVTGFRDLFASWVHHPLFGAMVLTAAVRGFDLHALAQFGAAKALALSGNPVGFLATEGPRPRIAALRLGAGEPEEMSVAVMPFDRFEWPDGALATPQAVRAAAIEAMASTQGSINRLRPGLLVLSGGAVDAAFDQMLVDGIAGALASHGKRQRGLAAVAGILPKVQPTGTACEVRFGFVFYPAANRNHSVGERVRIGTRGDHAGLF